MPIIRTQIRTWLTKHHHRNDPAVETEVMIGYYLHTISAQIQAYIDPRRHANWSQFACYPALRTTH